MTVSFGMNRNNHSSSNSYDSLLGHALTIGCQSKNIVAAMVFSKMCRICSTTEENGEDPPDHVYPKNYDGSSKETEADETLHLYTTIFDSSNKSLYLKAIKVDDDSSMRVLLKYRKINPKGMLPTDIPELE